MNFNLRILLSLLIIGTSILYTHRTKASNADIGYRDGLIVRTTINVKSMFYVQAEKYDIGEKYGVGIGFKNNNFNVILLVNQVVEDEKSFNGELKASYSDVRYNIFSSVGYGDEFSYELGAGYSISEKVSFILSYSDNGVMFGVRNNF